MYKYIIYGRCKSNAPDYILKKYIEQISESCQEDFTDYIDEKELQNLYSGYMKFNWNNILNYLEVKVSYYSDEQLSVENQIKLIDYTQGQLSDGIGEGFEQEPVLKVDELWYNPDTDENEDVIHISGWYSGQILHCLEEKL